MVYFKQVDPESYFKACVRDTCTCNTGGDCECFCSTVAAYAAACNDAGSCVKWRTPKICREWFYSCFLWGNVQKIKSIFIINISRHRLYHFKSTCVVLSWTCLSWVTNLFFLDIVNVPFCSLPQLFSVIIITLMEIVNGTTILVGSHA